MKSYLASEQTKSFLNLVGGSSTSNAKDLVMVAVAVNSSGPRSEDGIGSRKRMG